MDCPAAPLPAAAASSGAWMATVPAALSGNPQWRNIFSSHALARARAAAVMGTSPGMRHLLRVGLWTGRLAGARQQRVLDGADVEEVAAADGKGGDSLRLGLAAQPRDRHAEVVGQLAQGQQSRGCRFHTRSLPGPRRDRE